MNLALAKFALARCVLGHSGGQVVSRDILRLYSKGYQHLYIDVHAMALIQDLEMQFKSPRQESTRARVILMEGNSIPRYIA